MFVKFMMCYGFVKVLCCIIQGFDVMQAANLKSYIGTDFSDLIGYFHVQCLSRIKN